MSFAPGSPVWALHNGTWRPAAVAPPDEGEMDNDTVTVVFVDETSARVSTDALEVFNMSNEQRLSDPQVRAEVDAFRNLINTAAGEDGDESGSSSSSDEENETEGQATQPADDDDEATRQRKLDKKAKKALKKKEKKEKKEKKKKDKAEKKKSKKDKKDVSLGDAEDDDDLLLGATESSTKEKKDKKKDKKEKKKDKKSKKEKKEKRRHEAEMSQTQDESSEENEEESEDEFGLTQQDKENAALRNVSRLRSTGSSQLYSQRSLGSQSGPVIPPSASDLVLQRAEQTSRATPMNLRGMPDRKLLTEPTLDSIAQQLNALRAYYKSEVSKLAMGKISAGTGMTQTHNQVMPISEVDYLRAAERRLTSHRNALRILQCRQAQLIIQHRNENDQTDVDDFIPRIYSLRDAINKEAKYNVLEVFTKADAESKVVGGPNTYPGVPTLRPVLYRRADEPHEKSTVRYHHFSYIDKICETGSEMHLKAVSTIPTVPSKLQAEEIRRRELETMLSNNLDSANGSQSFDLGSMLPARLKGSVDGTNSRPRGLGLQSLLSSTNTTARGERSNVRVMTQWRAFRDFDVDLQKQRRQREMEDYLTTNRVQDILPPNTTARHFDFGGQRLEHRAERHAEHVLGRVMSTQNLAGASSAGQLSVGALLGGLSTQLGGITSSTNLPASDMVRTLTQGGVSQLNITDFGVSRNLKAKQARLAGNSSGLLTHAETQDADVASVYSSLGMDSEKSVDFEGHVGGVGMAPVDFGFDVENAFKSQTVDPGYPDLSEIKDMRHVKSADLPSVGPASEGIDSQASSWQEANEDRLRAPVVAGTQSPNNQFNDALQQRSPSPNTPSPASNLIRDVLVKECRYIYDKVKSLIAEAKRRRTPDLAVSGGGPNGSVVFSLHRLEGLHNCLITPVQLKTVITTLRDRILKTKEIQDTISEFYTKNEASDDIPSSVLLSETTKLRIRSSVMSYLARQYGIPQNGLHHMRLQRKSPVSTTQQAADTAQSIGSRRPRQSTYAYDE